MKIICIGRNFADHAKELGNDKPSSPVIFLKPDTALLRNNDPFFLPDFSKEIHHEIELVIKIKRLGKNIQAKFAHKYYDEIGLGVDFTARDVQFELREKGLPWEKAKAFDSSAAISKKFISKTELGDLTDLSFHLEKNGEKVQIGNTNQMIFTIEEIICYVSKYFTLKIGDLIYTGTPSGVGKVEINDELSGYLKDYKLFDFKIK
ncbi:MAG: 2-hydroxyhepta-2,4-diene-1,7-dioate isomerase [Flavobacteriales bacterium]|nr:2-hydroxyhepta-2,4-diene-1,7-dioate isomerase [Flavobacteriales bacterium]|tara:strand:- start:2053 stop:2667 length:615 start_codon:yes stop_codon:yes gene_type:complete